VRAPGGTGSRVSRGIGVTALVLLGLVLLYGLVLSPADEVQQDAVRLMYVHVPTVSVAYLAFGVTALASALWLWRRTRSAFWDRVAGASAEVGVLFTALCLASGMLWGRPTWGVYWTWDARLTTTVLLLVLFLGYLALRRVPADHDVRARRSAIMALVAFVDVPIVHQSVDWWRTLHQGATISTLDPQIDDLMLFTLMLSIVAFLTVYVWLVTHRYRVAQLEELLEDRALELAIEERRAEADAELATAPAGGGGAR
jgi:heme exporter protein C